MAKKTYAAIVIGASSGGVEALAQILPAFSDDFSLPIFIAQHQSENSLNDGFIEYFFNGRCQLNVKEAQHGEQVVPGTVYLSVPGYHLQLEMNGSLSLSLEPPVNYAIPSIDVLFETAAEVYQSRLVGVILTGANEDGAAGLALIKRYGGLAVVQDPDDADISYMPRAAIAKTNVDHILPLPQIGPFLASLDKIAQDEETVD